jgi:hypothetical protein
MTFNQDELEGIADIVEGTLDSMQHNKVEEGEWKFWTDILRKCGEEQQADEWDEAFSSE